MVAKVAGTAVFALAALWFSSDQVRFVIALIAAALVGAYAVRDLLYPVRLTADTDGVGVSRGLFGMRHLDWGEIARIRVDERRRLGAVTALLEIDVDITLFLFSKHEIGADPHETAATLEELRTTALARRQGHH